MHSILFVAAIMAIISFCPSFAAERDNGTIKEASKSKVRGGVAFGKFGGGGPDWPLPPLTAPPTTQDWRDVAVFDSDDNSNPFSKKAGPAFAKRFMMFATSKSGSGDAQHFTPQQADLWCKTNACTFDAFASEACTTDTWHLGAIYSETEQKQVAAKLTDGRHLVTGGRVDLSARNSISWTDQIIPQQGEYYPYTNWKSDPTAGDDKDYVYLEAGTGEWMHEPSTGMAAILCARCLPGSLSDYEDDCRDMTIPDSIDPVSNPALE